MCHRAITALSGMLRGQVGVGKSRLETLCMLVVGMVGARTVNLGHIATGVGRSVLIASTYRRLQRFFQHVDLGADWAVPLVAQLVGAQLVGAQLVGAQLVGAQGAWTLVLDRTNWKIGTHDVNYLVLAVVTRRFRVPLFWTLLDGPGNSATQTRVALMRRYLAHFPASTVRLLLGDREFIGAEWLTFLNDNNIPFAIRLRDDLRVVTEDGAELTLSARLRNRHRTRIFRARLWADGTADGPLFGFAAVRHCRSDQWRDMAHPRDRVADRRLQHPGPPGAGRLPQTHSPLSLGPMAQQWLIIECMFGDAKTRGLNLEDARLTDPRKLALLMALVALAIAWAGRAAANLIGSGSPKRKSHGHFAQSWFRTGFDRIRNLLASDPGAAIELWRTLRKHTPKLRQADGVL